MAALLDHPGAVAGSIVDEVGELGVTHVPVRAFFIENLGAVEKQGGLEVGGQVELFVLRVVRSLQGVACFCGWNSC